MTARQARDDAGTVTAFAVLVVVALLVAAGLVVDGGRIVDARLEAADVAAGAARAGAQATTGIRSGDVHLDPARAAGQAEAFLGAAGHHGHAVVDGDVVVVTVEVTRPMVLLGLAGVGPRTVVAVRSARAVDAEEGAHDAQP